MTITAAEILTEAVARTGRSDVSSITEELEAILFDLSRSYGFLETSGTVTVLASTRSITLSTLTGLRAVIGVQDASENLLEPIPYTEYLLWVNQDKATGTPTRWAYHNDTLYVHPKPSANAVFTVAYNYETNDTSTIAFPDRFQEAIIEGVCFKIYELRGLLGQVPEATTHKQLYDEQKTILITSYEEARKVV